MSATISMTYDTNNQNAAQMLQLLLASGFFKVSKQEQEWTKDEERAAFLTTSKHNFARISLFR